MRTPSPAEKKAQQILDTHGVDQLPVPVEAIAKSLKAEISYQPYEGEVSGMLYRADGVPPLIAVNSRHPSTRQRFTVAHEIGHLVLHKGRRVFVDQFVRVNWRDNHSDTEEIEANAFAAELLMPRQAVAREVQQAVDKNAEISPDQLAKRLAKTFRVSQLAMGYRLQNLGVVDPVALIG